MSACLISYTFCGSQWRFILKKNTILIDCINFAHCLCLQGGLLTNGTIIDWKQSMLSDQI